MKRVVIAIVFLASLLSMRAQQEVNTKFGKPTKEEMTMTVYAPDSSADAVVLCRLTDVSYTVQKSGYLVDYQERFRIKVLKPAGARFARVVVPFYKDELGKSHIKGSKFTHLAGQVDLGSAAGTFVDNAAGNYTTESVEDVKAVAYNWTNGKVEKSVMKRGAIATEKIDDEHYQVVFTVPDVREGTVIEYEYRVHSELFYQLHDWYAQWEIPVAYARLEMDIPRYLIFNVEEQGIQRLVCQCTTGTMRYKLESDAIAAPVNVNTNHYVCVGRDLVAMPKDSYVWNEHDHYAGITAELKGYSLPTTSFFDYAKTWEQIDGILLGDEDLGKRLDDHSPLRDEAAQLTTIADERERAAAVCRLVMGRAKWNGQYKLWPQSSAETLKKGEGSNADVNLLLIQSLRDAGLEASPVVLRTRSEGLLPYNFPSMRKLSTYVVGITLKNGTTVCVDASSANGYLDVLPEPLLVERARLVAKGKKSQWINLQKLSKSQTTTVIDAVLSADGTYSGTQTTLYKGLAAAKYRESKGLSEFAPEAKEEIQFTKQGEVSDGRISICPFNVPPMADNPLTATSRLMPVEFPSLMSESVIVNITLPSGYVLEEAAKQTVVSTPDKGVDGRLFMTYSEGKVQVHYQFNINKISQSEKNYTVLREMFDIFSKYSHLKLIVKPT